MAKIDDLITLTKAGFTKEEIMSLLSSSIDPTPEAPAAEIEQPAAAPEIVREEEKKDDIGAVIEQKIGEAFKPFENLYNQIAVKANMPTIGNIEPKGVDDIINDFFTK